MCLLVLVIIFLSKQALVVMSGGLNFVAGQVVTIKVNAPDSV